MTRQEDVTVSFHYLKYLDDPQDPDSARTFTSDEYENLLHSLQNFVQPDMGEKLIFERVRNGNIIPFYDFHRETKRCAFGRFKAPYTGHSYENSDHGKIEAASLNQRLFNYMLYQTKDGRIFAGAQYLGNYGGWTHLSNGLKNFFDQKNKIQATSIRNQSYYFENVFAKEIKIKVTKKSKSLAGNNVLTSHQIITLQRGDDTQGFESSARRNILSILQKPLSERKDALISSLKSVGLQEFDDYDIEDCVVIADTQNRTTNFHIFENGLRATRFHIPTALNSDGHPELDSARSAMKKAFTDYVLNDIAGEND